MPAGDGAMQFGRALTELNIDILCATSPQAKGRVERAFGALQDRLVKQLRLAGITTVEAVNAWLPEFVEDDNKRFGPGAGEREKSAPSLMEADAHPPASPPPALDQNQRIVREPSDNARSRSALGRRLLSRRALSPKQRRVPADLDEFGCM